MKVLENADVFEISCKACGSMLEITRDDLDYDFNFGHYSYLYVVCGACRRRVDLSKIKLPADWQQHINNLIADVCGDDY
ncbi:MAG: hypothetical protein HY226_05100 [Candidatus Vogelbacteria bacterium]|nr:hypothetical protein [Candidatus Vogelbacteria bacterium]